MTKEEKIDLLMKLNEESGRNEYEGGDPFKTPAKTT